MLTIIDRYIHKSILFGILLVSLILCAINIVFIIAGDSGSLNQSGRPISQSLLKALLTTPTFYSSMLPAIAATGTLIGLSYLAKKRELVIIHAAGISKLQLMKMVGKLAFVIGIFSFLLIAYLAPMSNHWFTETQASSNYIAQNLWLKDKNAYLFVKQVNNNSLQGVNLFILSKKGVTKTYHADSATFDQHWVLHEATVTDYLENKPVSQHRYPTLILHHLILPSLLKNSIISPDQLTLPQLNRLSHYRASNQLTDKNYQLQLWQMFTLPLSIILMMILMVPFVYGQLRSHHFVLRILVGILVSISFYFINQIITPLAIIFNWPSWLGVGLPLLLVAIIFGIVAICDS